MSVDTERTAARSTPDAAVATTATTATTATATAVLVAVATTTTATTTGMARRPGVSQHTGSAHP
ncbi:MAG: hypothetical protein KBF84_08740, partial [Candidatus Microthrix sp.]|nr:hypothetical protein [Candidatus Microthrix sp.]